MENDWWYVGLVFHSWASMAPSSTEIKGENVLRAGKAGLIKWICVQGASWHSAERLNTLQGCPPGPGLYHGPPGRGCTWWALQLEYQDKQASL